MDRVWPVITNREAIAINHAWAGLPGTLFKTLLNGTVEVWAKPLPANEVAVLLLNTLTTDVEGALVPTSDVLGGPRSQRIRDVWNHADVDLLDGKLIFKLHAHDSMLAVMRETQDATGWRPAPSLREFV